MRSGPHHGLRRPSWPCPTSVANWANPTGRIWLDRQQIACPVTHSCYHAPPVLSIPAMGFFSEKPPVRVGVTRWDQARPRGSAGCFPCRSAPARRDRHRTASRWRKADWTRIRRAAGSARRPAGCGAWPCIPGAYPNTRPNNYRKHRMQNRQEKRRARICPDGATAPRPERGPAGRHRRWPRRGRRLPGPARCRRRR